MTRRQLYPHPIYRRKPELVASILGLVADLDRDDHLHVLELEDLLADAYPPKTVANTLAELADFGAIQKIGTYKRGRDTRAYRSTELGRSWLDQRLPPLL